MGRSAILHWRGVHKDQGERDVHDPIDANLEYDVQPTRVSVDSMWPLHELSPLSVAPDPLASA